MGDTKERKGFQEVESKVAHAPAFYPITPTRKNKVNEWKYEENCPAFPRARHL